MSGDRPVADRKNTTVKPVQVTIASARLHSIDRHAETAQFIERNDAVLASRKRGDCPPYSRWAAFWVYMARFMAHPRIVAGKV